MLCAVSLAPAVVAAEPWLVARAVLPADTFAPGPTSGQSLPPLVNGRVTPFVNAQPVQGFSALLALGDGTYGALSDNGFGSRESSADFELRIYRVRPHFETARGGSGRIEVLSFVVLRDPDRRLPFAIVAEGTSSRVLTGADLDPESMQRAPDGTLWIGDEFGPFLLHFAADGRLLDAPYPLPDYARGGEISAPQSPLRRARLRARGEAQAGSVRAAGSGGFEALAIAPDGRHLYALLERPLAGDRVLLVSEFDLARRRYTGRQLTYALDPRASSATDFVLFDARRGLVLERDESSGTLSGFKAVFEVRLPDEGSTIEKRPRIDLLAIDNPHRLGGRGLPGDIGLGRRYAMPFVTIESLVVLSPLHVAVMNDNNYPKSVGRHVGSGQPDDTELVVIRLDAPL